MSIILLPHHCQAQAVINEFMATPTDRGLHWEGDIPSLGSGIAWTSLEFDDSEWPGGMTPLGFGYSGLATTVQMVNLTPSVYLRTIFTVSETTALRTDLLRLQVDFDDGFIAYLNGVEIARKALGKPGGFIFFDQPAYMEHQAGSPMTFLISNAMNYLKAGDNVLAIQAHNRASSNPDLKIHALLDISTAPSVSMVNAASTWKYHIGLTEPSGGIPKQGGFDSDWKLAWTRLDYDAEGWPIGRGGFGYGDNDDTTVLNISGSAASIYTRIIFDVSEELLAANSPLNLFADYDDGFAAYLNGVEVARRNLGTPGVFVGFDQMATSSREAGEPEVIPLGNAASLLTPGKNILAVQGHNFGLNSTDFSLKMDLMAGDVWLAKKDQFWSYYIGMREPAGSSPPIETDFSDWVEILNSSAAPINLAGWSLTDDRTEKDKFVFPDISLDPGQVVVVLASGLKDATGTSDSLHAGFELSGDGEYLGLYNNASPRQAADEIFPAYPPQSKFHSYARLSPAGPFRYTDIPSPGNPAILGNTYETILPSPEFSLAHGIYATSQTLILSCAAAGAEIRYTTDGSEPTWTHGKRYEGPLQLTKNTVLRTRSLLEGHIPSKVATRTYLFTLMTSGLVEIPDRDFVVMIGYVNQNPTTLVGPMTNAYPTELVSGSALGQTFVAPQPFNRIGSSNPTWFTTTASFRLSLYDKPEGTRLATRVIVNAVDNATNYLEFPVQPAGSYYLEISEVSGGQVGWWGESSDIYPLGAPYRRFVPSPGSFEALSAIPAISVVSDWGRNLFEPFGTLAINGGSYASGKWEPAGLDDSNHIIMHGRAYERPISVEYIPPAPEGGFQVDCGMRPGRSDVWRPGLRRTDGPWLGVAEKLTFRFYFRGDYGPKELEHPLFPDNPVQRFDVLAIRSGNDTDYKNPFVKEQFTFRMLKNCGQVAPHCRTVNIFINGEFKNYYSLTERLDEAFFQEHFGSANSWDVIRSQVPLTFQPTLELAHGDYAAWDDLFMFLKGRNLADYSLYQEAVKKVDVTGFIDYLLVNLYSANQDWPWNNWTAARERVPDGRFRFFEWDSDISFLKSPGVTTRSIDKLEGESNHIPVLYRALKASPEFKLLFADRIQKHFFNNGALSKSKLTETFQVLRADVEDMIAQVYGGEPFDTYILDTWIPQRQEILIQHLSSAGLWSTIKAPLFNQYGGEVPEGFQLTMEVPAGGSGGIFYTVDGNDPRTPGTGSVSPSAISYANPVNLAQTTHVKARIRNLGFWGPLVEAQFLVNQEAGPGDILITEFLANPAGSADDGKEWFEVYNTTEHPIDINGWTIADNGTDNHIISSPQPVLVPAKGHFVIGESTNFSSNGGVNVGYAYGPAITLGNSNDEIVLLKDGQVIHSIGYGAYDSGPKEIQTPVVLYPTSGAAIGMGADYCNSPTTLWKPQTTVFNSNNDKGTPGAVNDGVSLCGGDSTPPGLQSAKFARGDLILVSFSEPINPSGAEIESHYTLSDGIGSPVTAELVSVNSVLLSCAQRLSPGVVYTLTIHSASDSYGNAIPNPIQAPIHYNEVPVSINEIMYNDRDPDDIEWIELHNTTAAAIDISNWYITDDNAYPAQEEGNLTFPNGTVLEAGEYAVVNLWNNPRFSTWQFPESIRVIQPVVGESGSLSNSGDNIALYNAPSGGQLVDGSLQALYPDLASDGRSLEKIDEAFPWGDPETVSYNFRAATVPIGFVTGQSSDGELLSSQASPGRENGSPYPLAVKEWSQY